jgi:hypothetical protein
LIVVEMANALRTPSMARTVPIARIRPGVVLTNHHLGFGGSVVVCCASGSLEGCASSTVTCADLAPFGGVPGARATAVRTTSATAVRTP